MISSRVDALQRFMQVSQATVLPRTFAGSAASAGSAGEAANPASLVSLSAAGRELAYRDNPGAVLTPLIATPIIDPALQQRVSAESARVEAMNQHLYSEAGIQEMAAQLQKQGDDPQKAVIRLDGKIVGSLGTTYGLMTTNALGALIEDSGGDHEAALARLQSQFGSRLEIERFADGQGPSYATVDQQMNGGNYAARMADSLADFRREAALWQANNPSRA